MTELKLNNIFCKIFFIHKYEKNKEPKKKQIFFYLYKLRYNQNVFYYYTKSNFIYLAK
jgi:hypothetical protein